MDPELADQTAGTPEAVEAPSPGGTEGSGTSPEAAETRSPAEIARDIFLEKYGSADEDEVVTSDADEVEATDAETKPEAASEPARNEGTEDPKLPRVPKEIFDAAHPTMREAVTRLREQHRQSTAQLEEANRRVQEYEPAQTAVQSLRTFAQENNLPPEAISESLTVRGLYETEKFQEFIDAITPFWERAHRALGKAISPEIQALVDSGDVTETAAFRMSQAEERRALAEAAAARERTARTSQTEQTAQQAHAKALDTAAKNVEAALRASDPDFDLKEPAIKEQFKEALEYGWRPKNAADVDAMIRKLHARALVAPKPALQSTQPRPGASTTPTRKPAPRTTLEAVEMAYAEKAPR